MVTRKIEWELLEAKDFQVGDRVFCGSDGIYTCVAKSEDKAFFERCALMGYGPSIVYYSNDSLDDDDGFYHCFLQSEDEWVRINKVERNETIIYEDDRNWD